VDVFEELLCVVVFFLLLGIILLGVGYLWPVLDIWEFVVGLEINIADFERDGL
jgi:hypothetical protein